MRNSKPYFIGQGTGTLKEFDTLKEMFDFHKMLDCLDRHFCKLYDRNKGRLIEGWAIWKDYSDENPDWRKW